jgi:hypothetical protein
MAEKNSQGKTAAVEDAKGLLQNCDISLPELQ